MLGINFDENIYENIGKIFELVPQTNKIFENISEEKITSVDISLDEVVDLIQKSSENSTLPTEVLDMKEMVAEFERFSSFAKFVIREVGKSFLNTNVKMFGEKFMITNAHYANILNVILHKRNDPIIAYIIDNPNQNIAVVYGSLHYEGVLE